LLCSRPLHSSPLLSFSHTIFKRARTGDDAILSSIHPPRLRCSPYGFPACHLSLSRALRRHSSILAESEEPRYFFFYSLSFSFTGGTRRSFFLPQGVCYAARVAESRGFRTPLLFFFLFYAFRQLTDARFSFFFLRFSHRARVLRPQQAIRRQEGITAITAVVSSITPKPPSPDKHARKLERRSPRRSIKK
jgi:hypothetical protein